MDFKGVKDPENKAGTLQLILRQTNFFQLLLQAKKYLPVGEPKQSHLLSISQASLAEDLEYRRQQ